MASLGVDKTLGFKFIGSARWALIWRVGVGVESAQRKPIGTQQEGHLMPCAFSFLPPTQVLTILAG
ncbi:MAG TPA: hypothetical protein DCR93_27150 [Cytophagales bacterium]|nr:hypothetical protein [Cytophagales bacterium]HAP63019.1 hypothetical protein [Cytophagales bacterium]